MIVIKDNGLLGPFRPNNIYPVHALEGLKALPDECIHLALTSPPFWGLRDYSNDDLIWGGDENCDHEWTHSSHYSGGGQPDDKVRWQHVGAGPPGHPKIKSSFCSKCNAWKGSLGLEPTPELFTAHLVMILHEVWRVLRKDGVFWLNLGDCFMGGGRGGDKTKGPGREGALRNLKHKSLKPKDLVGIPWRVAFALQGFSVVPGRELEHAADLLKYGREIQDWTFVEAVEKMLRGWSMLAEIATPWWNRGDIIWWKKSPMPESVDNRPTRSHEFIFQLVKSGKPQFWTHRNEVGTRKKPNPDYRWVHATGQEVAEQPENWDPKKRIPCPDCEGIGELEIKGYAEFGEGGEWVPMTEPCEKCKGSEDHTVVEWKRLNLWSAHSYFYDAYAVLEPLKGKLHSPGNKNITQPKEKGFRDPAYDPDREWGNLAGRNLRSVWSIAPQPRKEAHFATFPDEIVRICVEAGSSCKACPHCGAPWSRVVEKERTFESGSGKSGNMPVGKSGENLQGGGETLDIRRGPVVHITTTGFRPTCRCKNNTGSGRCLILDPFMGLGITADIARKLGRDYIGFELNAHYIEMAYERMEPLNFEDLIRDG